MAFARTASSPDVARAPLAGIAVAAALVIAPGGLPSAAAQSAAKPPAAVVTVRQATPETALAAAQAALASCRKAGFQVGVAVVDRAGTLQALLRDRFAGAHTVEAATRKAWTSASFRMSTTDLARETQAGRPMSGLRDLPMVLAAGGGLPIEAGGQVIGAIGVSGAPGGEADEACAKAGVAAAVDAVELGD